MGSFGFWRAGSVSGGAEVYNNPGPFSTRGGGCGHGAGFARIRPVPVYQFACPACRRTLRFFARRPVADADPPCPHCGGKLSREVERFLAGPRAGEADAVGAGARDPARTAAALAARGADLADGDPRRRAEALLAVAREGGIAFSPEIADALRRVGAGGDPAALDAALDAVLESGGAALAAEDGAAAGAEPFSEDETLYDLPLPPLPPRKPSAWS